MKLITNLTNIHYLTGFSGSYGLLLMGRTKNILLSDSRYSEQGATLAKKSHEKNSPSRIPFEFETLNAKSNWAKLLGSGKSIQYESHHMAVEQLKQWQKRFPKKEWIAIKSPIEKMRAQKDESEIKLLRKSQQINEAVLEAVHKKLKTGVSELEVAWWIRSIGHELGAEDISFTPIVAFGSHSAAPHHQNSSRKLKANEAVLIDMGMKWKGYCSDMTRSFFYGKPSTEYIEIYEAVLRAQLAGIQKIKTGVKAKQVDLAARDSMGELKEHFGHSFGHGIGLDVHENPNLSSRSTDSLKENMIVTAEPGIYLPGKFGVRIEDMGQVTAKGYKNFTKFSKELYCARVRS